MMGNGINAWKRHVKCRLANQFTNYLPLSLHTTILHILKPYGRSLSIGCVMTSFTGRDIPLMPTPLMRRYLIMAFTSFSSIWPGRILISMAHPMPQECHKFKVIGMWGSPGIKTTSSSKGNLNLTLLHYRGLSRQLSGVSILASGQHLMLLCRHTKILTSSSNYSSSIAQVGQARPLCTMLSPPRHA